MSAGLTSAQTILLLSRECLLSNGVFICHRLSVMCDLGFAVPNLMRSEEHIPSAQ